MLAGVVQALGEALQINSKLLELHVNNNNVGDAGAQAHAGDLSRYLSKAYSVTRLGTIKSARKPTKTSVWRILQNYTHRR